MTSTTLLLLTTALSVGFFHTVLGPDHYLPFVAMARVGGWSRRKTMVITALCGLGHIGGSVALGMVGIALGLSLSRLEGVEAMRGTWAAWGLILFGLLYAAWGIRKVARGRRHTHLHGHGDGTVHSHPHNHDRDHLHSHGRGHLHGQDRDHLHGQDRDHLHGQAPEDRGRMTPWVLFVIFLLGPCEALIPLLMFPAATESWMTLLLVTGAFGGATLVTMMALVLVGLEGSKRVILPGLSRYGHVAAGVVVFLCGVAIQFLGM